MAKISASGVDFFKENNTQSLLSGSFTHDRTSGYSFIFFQAIIDHTMT